MIKDAEITGIWGGRGSGKSTRAKALTNAAPRLIVVDPLGDWGRKEKCRVVTTHRDLYKAIRDGWGKGFRICFDIGRVPDKVAALHKLSNDLFAIQQPYKDGRDARKIVLVVDEMSITVPNRALAAHERGFQDLCNLGRHYGVSIIGISQRMAQVHTDFRGNTATDYYFRLGEAVDVQKAMQKIGRAHMATLRGLQVHEYLQFRHGQATKGRNKL